jgi:hypothetical protein
MWYSDLMKVLNIKADRQGILNVLEEAVGQSTIVAARGPTGVLTIDELLKAATVLALIRLGDQLEAIDGTAKSLLPM